MHPRVAWGTVGHGFWHPPQWSTLVVVFTSQPSSNIPLQFAQLLSQAMAQYAFVHIGAEWALSGQAWPQAPQFEASFVALTSHPSSTSELQFKWTESHMMPHHELAHVGVEYGLSGQTAPHAPQLLMSFVLLISQPSLALALQSNRPVSQTNPQDEPEQVGVALDTAGHVLLHPPQWFTSLVVLISQPSLPLTLQSARPLLQTNPQDEPEQVGVAFDTPGHA